MEWEMLVKSFHHFINAMITMLKFRDSQFNILFLTNKSDFRELFHISTFICRDIIPNEPNISNPRSCVTPFMVFTDFISGCSVFMSVHVLTKISLFAEKRVCRFHFFFIFCNFFMKAIHFL